MAVREPPVPPQPPAAQTPRFLVVEGPLRVGNSTADLPLPDLVIYLQAKPEVLRARIAKKGAREETRIADEYIEEVVHAYEHFFFRYSASDLLVVDTSAIDFVERSADLQQLLRRLQDPVKGTQYFLPLGASE